MTAAKTTILVADDDQIARELLAAHLSVMGFALVFAEDGQAALETAREVVPDIILLDVMMPKMTGFEVCAAIRQDPQLKQIPILMITTLDDRDSRLAGLEAGADEFITKPFDSRELRARIELIAELNRFRGIQREKEKFQRMVDLAPDGILMVDQNLEIVFVNQAATNLFASTAALPLVGTRFPFLVHLMIGGQFDEILFAELQATKEVRHLNGTFQRLDGATFPANLSVGTFDWEDRPALQINVSDLTNQRQLEEQLLRSQRLQGLGSIAGGIVHDFNNVIMPIVMGTDVLTHTLTDPADLEVLEMIAVAAQRGGNLVQQILTFARGSEQQMGTVKLRHITKEVAQLLAKSLPANVELKTCFAPEELSVVGDPTQLIQVLMNLCVNARDALPEGGVIEIELKSQPDEIGNQRVVMVVSDTGTGMSAETVEKLGQPFFTTKAEGEGTGLGMATVKTILRNHGVELRVRSELGKGSTFEMIFEPAATSEPTGVADSPRQEVYGSGELILICDDEAAVREIVSSTMACYGYEILQAGDGAEARALCQQHADRLAAIVTDLRMPYLNGLRLIQSIGEDGDRIPSVIMTTDSSKEQRCEIEEAGAVLLVKPFTTAELLSTVARVLRDPVAEPTTARA